MDEKKYYIKAPEDPTFYRLVDGMKKPITVQELHIYGIRPVKIMLPEDLEKIPDWEEKPAVKKKGKSGEAADEN